MHATHDDAIHAELEWYFRHASFEAEAAFALGAIALTGDLADVPEVAFDTHAIARNRRVRTTLAALDEPHADVLGWAFEQRQWHPRIVSTFSWPGVAVRTVAAQWALAVAGRDARVVGGELVAVPTGEHRDGIIGFLLGLKPKGEIVKTIREETSRRVEDAFAAYASARRPSSRVRKSRAA